ncbi:MAG TPA: hypothetical protein VMZ52_00305 [Bryobacteraceae bacterium]|nr:hypothetical protein [Bryobacteraceae bacterium]
MDDDRKYRQHGYQDYTRKPGGQNGDDRPRTPQGPRSLQDPNGPRLPRLVQSVAASRCYNCSTLLAPGTEFKGKCPKCHVDLHCCKQCAHFEPSTRFQCVKPIPARIPYKDQHNECELFSVKVTVSRDGSHPPPPPAAQITPDQVRSPHDARTAFDNLFKK